MRSSSPEPLESPPLGGWRVPLRENEPRVTRVNASPRSPAELAAKLTADELDALRSNVAEKRREHALKSLDERGSAQELVRDEYAGCYPFELIQNANDAAGSDGARGRRVQFVLTETALLVADQGAGFGADQVEAICTLGRSSKDPRKNIGYKGLGFKSVYGITRAPQIFSPQVQFGFDAAKLRRLVTKIAGGIPDDQRLPEYAFPFAITLDDAGSDREMVAALQDEYCTILRLPFKSDVSRAQVENTLRQTVRPRLLLFLDALDELGVAGTTADDFVATTERQRHDGYSEVLLESEGQVDHFRVFEAHRPITDRTLVADLGGTWDRVENVRLFAAVPLDDRELPTIRHAEPFHVYFPTAEPSGLPILLSGDFHLKSDRQRLASTPNSQRYNEWLMRELASFLTGSVIHTLLETCAGHPRVLAALARPAPPGEWAQLLHDGLVEGLQESACIPCKDGVLRVPDQARLLPESVVSARPDIPDIEVVHEMLSGYGSLAHPDLEGDETVRAFLTEDLGVKEVGGAQVVRDLSPGESQIEAYYELLVAWDRQSLAFYTWLRNADCVRLVDGNWRCPADAYLPPPKHSEIRFPAGLHVPIADLPEVECLPELLGKAGLQQFEWRHSITEFVMPILSEPAAEEDRQPALDLVREYYQMTGGRDETIRRAAGKTLLRVKDASDGQQSWLAARFVYFSEDWMPEARMMQLYGRFGHSEFLDEPVPEAADDRQAEAEFLKWLGVGERPRVFFSRNASGLPTHAQSQESRFDDEWTDSNERSAASTCPDGHPQTQILQPPPRIDRLDDLVTTGDWECTRLLWDSIARHWDHYERFMSALWRCDNSAHGRNKPTRPFPSLIAHTLKTATWVPAVRGKQNLLEQPNSVWLGSAQTPNLVLDKLPVLAPGLAAPPAMQQKLGLIDAEHPTANNLIGLLRVLEETAEHSSSGVTGLWRPARWAMGKLDRVAAQIDEADVDSIPLLAKSGGVTVLRRHPYVWNDRIAADLFDDVVPIYDGDKELRNLIDTLALPNLDELVHAQPKCRRRDPVAEATTAEHIELVKPYLLACALQIAPDMQDDLLDALGHLGVVCGQDFHLEYRMGDQLRICPDLTTYIHVTNSSDHHSGCGTAYFALDPESGMVDWISFGPRLAGFAGVPRAGDAFVFLLDGDDSARRRFLRSRRLSSVDIASAVKLLAEHSDSVTVTANTQTTHDASVESGTNSGDVPASDWPQPAPAELRDSPSPEESGMQESLIPGVQTPAAESPETAPQSEDPSQRIPADSVATSPPNDHDQRATAAPAAASADSWAHGRFYSYVTKAGSRQAHLAAESENVAPEIDLAGVRRVLAYERNAGRDPEEQTHGNPGFDIASHDTDGSLSRIVEVKSLSGPWAERGVPVSKRQIAENRQRGDLFWLYIVEYANDDSRARVIPIRNPIAHADYFVFDSDWEPLSDDAS
jgi:hypothetical protein